MYDVANTLISKWFEEQGWDTPQLSPIQDIDGFMWRSEGEAPPRSVRKLMISQEVLDDCEPSDLRKFLDESDAADRMPKSGTGGECLILWRDEFGQLKLELRKLR